MDSYWKESIGDVATLQKLLSMAEIKYNTYPHAGNTSANC